MRCRHIYKNHPLVILLIYYYLYVIFVLYLLRNANNIIMDNYHKAIENLLKDGSLKLNFEITKNLMTVMMSLRHIYFDYSSTNLTPRSIHHYNREGIIPQSEKLVKGRKKFNFYQILWLHIVENLREVGYPLKNIKIIKGELFDKLLLNDQSKKLDNLSNFSAFEFTMTMAVLSEDQLHFIALKDGKYGFVSDKSILTYTLDYTYHQQVHINLPLANLISRILELIPSDSPYGNIKTEWLVPIYEKLLNYEFAVLNDINRGAFKNIVIHYSDGAEESYQQNALTSELDRIRSAIYNSEYHTITLTDKAGKVVKIQRTENEILK